MGRLNPTADWWEKGGVDPGRIERIGRKWMLPSRQLVFFEGIDEAARVICREQLGSELPAVTGPSVFSDPSDRPGPGARDPHWDIHFVFDGRWTTTTPPSNPMWHELAFVEVPKTPRAEIARGQADVLELIGIRPLE